MRRVGIAAVVGSIVCSVASASGKPDPHFGTDGTLVMHVDRIAPTGTEGLRGGLVDRKGRYVSFGEATYKPEGYFDTIDAFTGTGGLITRHLPDGRLDPTFGDGGVMHQDIFNYFLRWDEAVELADGSLIVAGSRHPAYTPGFPETLPPLVCHVQEDGSLDMAFGINGCRALDLMYPNPFGELVDMQVMGDGRIVLLGTADGAPTPFLVARLQPNGEDDNCFGSATCQAGGWIFGSPAMSNVSAKAMVVDASGAITIAGVREVLNEPNDPQEIVDTDTTVVMRFKPNGTVDTGFGIAGLRRIDYSPLFAQELISQGVTSMVEDMDGGVVIGGYVALQVYPDESFVAVARLDKAGNLDASFATLGLGLFRYDDTMPVSAASAMSRQTDGKLLLAGHAGGNNTDVPALLRLDQKGGVDPQFGLQGVVKIPTPPAQNWTYFADVEATDNRVVLFGTSAIYPQDISPVLAVLDRDGLFGDAFEDAD